MNMLVCLSKRHLTPQHRNYLNQCRKIVQHCLQTILTYYKVISVAAASAHQEERVRDRRYPTRGQELARPLETDGKQEMAGLSRGKRFLTKYRRLIGFCTPALFFHFFWWAAAIEHSLWGLFPENYPMTITMVFGSMIAGMTSVGGGAVAFPVMTLALNIDPNVARDVVLMIQSIGMTAASFTIFFMRVRVEWRALIWCSLGGIGGIIFGLHLVDPYLSSATKKLGFVSIWMAFATVLVFLNRSAKRRTFSDIFDFNWWRLLVLMLFGFIGGIFTSFSGSGLDISSFAILTLLFQISEKVATPTSVIVMSFNSMVGFYWRGVIMADITQEAVDYWLVCVPVIVIGAPLGSLLGSHFHRLVLAALVIILDTFAFASAYAIVEPLTAALVGGCIGVMVACIGLFIGFVYAGERLMQLHDAKEQTMEVESITSDQKTVDIELTKEDVIADIVHIGDTHACDNHAYVNDVQVSPCYATKL